MAFLTKIIVYITSIILLVSPGNTFTEGVVGQPRSFFPSQLETQADKTISKLIYRGLFKYDIYGELVPDLAEGWEVSEDGLVYTVTLKVNQKWHDASPITSDDIIYTSSKVPALTGVATDRVDDKTVRFTLPNKFSPFLSLLTVGIMKVNTEENESPLNPIGNGDFKVISVNHSGPIVKEVILYNLNDNEDIRKLAFRFYSNEDELDMAARLGEITGFLALDKHDLENFNELQFPLQSVHYALFLNLRRDTFKDIEFRKKLRAALPMEYIVGDDGVLVQGPIRKNVFTDEQIPVDHFDDSLAEEALGYNFTITIPDLPAHKETAKKVKGIWEDKFNVEIEIKAVDPEKINDEVIASRDFDVLLYGQEVGRDPDRYVYWHSTQTEAPNLNITGFQHVRADRALEEGRNVTDPTDRRVHYHEFQSVIEEQVPAIFLYHPFVKYYVSEYFTGIGEKYTFTATDRFLDFSNWKRIETN